MLVFDVCTDVFSSCCDPNAERAHTEVPTHACSLELLRNGDCLFKVEINILSLPVSRPFLLSSHFLLLHSFSSSVSPSFCLYTPFVALHLKRSQAQRYQTHGLWGFEWIVLYSQEISNLKVYSNWQSTDTEFSSNQVNKLTVSRNGTKNKVDFCHFTKSQVS